MNRRLRLVINLAVSAMVLGYVLMRVDYQRLGRLLLTGNRYLFGAAFFLIWLTHLTQVVRWHYLLAAESEDLSFAGYLRLLFAGRGFRKELSVLFRYHLIGNFFQLFLPSTASGDLVKGYFSLRGVSRRGASLAAIVVGRILGIVCAVSVALAAVWAVRDPLVRREILGNPGLWIIIAGLAGTIIFLVSIRRQARGGSRTMVWLAKSRAGRLLAEMVESLGMYRHRWRALGWGFMLSAVVHLLMIATGYAIFSGLGWREGILIFAVYLPLIYVFTILPVSFNGIGVREALFIYFLGPYGCTNELVIGYAAVGYGMVFAVGVAGWFFYLAERVRNG